MGPRSCERDCSLRSEGASDRGAERVLHRAPEGVAIEVDPNTFAHVLSDTLQLARRYRLSSYDASYLELALRMALPLATLDADLHRAASKAGVKTFKAG